MRVMLGESIISVKKVSWSYMDNELLLYVSNTSKEDMVISYESGSELQADVTKLLKEGYASLMGRKYMMVE